MVFCNGFGCSQHIWRHLTTALSQHHQLVFFDYIGTGETDPKAYDPQKYASLAGYAQDVVAICEALALRDVVLIGHSVGATIALLAATAAPTYFKQVVLLAPSPYYLNEPGYYGGFERADVEQLLAMFDRDGHQWAIPFANLLLGPTTAHSAMEELTTYFCEMDETVGRQLARITFLSDHRTDVTHLHLPTLIIQSAQDAAVPAEVVAYLAQQLPEAKQVQLPTMGHCPHLSAPLETIAAIAAFVR